MMKIGVTFENEQIFQYFGHTKQFKIYNIEDKKLFYLKCLILMAEDIELLLEFYSILI